MFSPWSSHIKNFFWLCHFSSEYCQNFSFQTPFWWHKGFQILKKMKTNMKTPDLALHTSISCGIHIEQFCAHGQLLGRWKNIFMCVLLSVCSQISPCFHCFQSIHLCACFHACAHKYMLSNLCSQIFALLCAPTSLLPCSRWMFFHGKSFQGENDEPFTNPLDNKACIIWYLFCLDNFVAILEKKCLKWLLIAAKKEKTNVFFRLFETITNHWKWQANSWLDRSESLPHLKKIPSIRFQKND